MVADLRRCAESGAGAPPVLLVFQASVEAGVEFFAERWPDARAIADPERVLYAEFGRERGRLADFLAPRVWWRAFRALLRGFFVGKPVGDPTVMPGLFAVRGREILREHRFRDVADHPDPCAFAAEAAPV